MSSKLGVEKEILSIFTGTVARSFRTQPPVVATTISETALIFWWIDLGLGKHQATVEPADLAMGPKIIFIATFFYDCNISLPKFSALFFYNRIFGRTNKWFTIALWTVGTLNTGWLLSSLVSTIFQCTPINAAWEVVPGSTCIAQWSWFFGTAIPSMIIDFLILIMPLPILWGLKAPISRRIMVGTIFLCGYWWVSVSLNLRGLASPVNTRS